MFAFSSNEYFKNAGITTGAYPLGLSQRYRGIARCFILKCFFIRPFGMMSRFGSYREIVVIRLSPYIFRTEMSQI